MAPRSRRAADRMQRDSGQRRDGGARRDTVGRRSRRQPGGVQRRRLPPELVSRIQDDPLYQVTTIDGSLWIDPYTGREMPAEEGYQKAAEDYFRKHPVYRDNPLLSLEQLTCIRWRHDLMRLLPHEPRLRIFGRNDEGWLNPYSGTMVSDVAREDGRITVRTITAMSEALAASPEAATGLMLDNATLQQKVNDLGSEQGTRDPVDESVFGLGQMEADLNRAKDVQANMLADLPQLEGYDLAVHFVPHSAVSGDFYEVLPLKDGRVLLVLGDVSGHGVQAALVVATALKTLRLLSRHTTDLVQLLSQLNDEIKTDVLPGQFITVFAALFEPRMAKMQIVLAGHHPMLIANPKREVILRRAGKKGMAVGLIAGEIFKRSLKPVEIEIEPNDLCLQFTDGIFEAVDAEGNEYGESRLHGRLVAASGAMNVEDLVQTLAADVVEFASGQPEDDLTLFALGRLGEETGIESGGYAAL